jgi:hypothetical protein
MAYRVRTTRDLDEWAAAASAIGHYFGWQPTEEDAARFAKLLPLDRMHAVWDNGAVVAGAGVFPFGLTVPEASCRVRESRSSASCRRTGAVACCAG